MGQIIKVLKSDQIEKEIQPLLNANYRIVSITAEIVHTAGASSYCFEKGNIIIVLEKYRNA